MEGEELVVPDEVKKDFEGLTYIGRLEDEFEIAGHKVKLRTLKSGEYLRALRGCAKDENTVGYNRAQALSILSYSIVSIDGKGRDELYIMAHTDDDQAEGIRRFLEDKYYTSFVYWMFEKYLELSQRAEEVMNKLPKS